MQKSEAIPDEILDIIINNRSFLITSHKNPDGDAIGSMLAMAGILKKMGKETYLFLEDGVPPLYRFLPLVEEVNTVLAGNFDITLVLDCENAGRISDRVDLFSHARTLINIDHHPTTGSFGDYRYINPRAAAVGEQVHALARALDVAIDRNMAECIYVSILTDTGSFRYANTTAHTHRLAAGLIEHGLHPADIASRIYERRSLNQLCLQAAIIEDMVVEDTLAWSVVGQDRLKDLGLSEPDLDGAIDIIRSVDGVRVAVLFSQRFDGKIKASLRSKNDFNVLEAARELGGGGHKAAAGFLSSEPLSVIVQKTVQLLRERLGLR
ncbi:MAG: DHH family phosphoesterase [bacterium]|nr:bifunctional oligoribonuclease/PAP phosphatase NrnA [bacterium]MDD3805979.1 bifunctional oligoribonuclease/PAP phosphatase NrnA [bacterium]